MIGSSLGQITDETVGKEIVKAVFGGHFVWLIYNII